MSDGLGGKIMTDFAPLRPITYYYSTENNDINKKSKRHKKVCHRKKT